jgi:hypothetical protein
VDILFGVGLRGALIAFIGRSAGPSEEPKIPPPRVLLDVMHMLYSALSRQNVDHQQLPSEFRMDRVAILILFVALNFATTAIGSAPPPAHPTEAIAGYVPEVGQMMDSIQLRHAKLWFAGTAGNWALAAYELNEIREDFQLLAKFRSVIKERQIALTIETVMVAPIAQVEDAVSAKDHAAFEKAFGDLTSTCNACHQGAGYPFISITRPNVPPVTNQRFGE